MNDILISSKNITWKGKRGVTCLTDHYLFHGRSMPEYIYIWSHKTGVIKEFGRVHDEDGFDGELFRYASYDGIELDIAND